MRFALAFVCGFLLGSSPAFALTTDDWNTIVDETNFEVAERCSGTLIDVKNRLVLTAHHCVSGNITTEEQDVDDDGELQKRRVRKLETLQVAQYNYDQFKRIKSVSYDADILAFSDELDLAVVQIAAEIPNTRESTVAVKDPIRGEKVKIVGNPGLMYGSLVDSNISSVARQVSVGKKRNVIQLPFVFFGNSGGAIYNESGEIVGVAHAKRRDTDVLGYAIPASSINQFLTDNCSKLGRC
jgi:hypothetical protein